MTWLDRARVEALALARSGAKFTSDDLIDRVGVPDDGHSANGRNSAIGSVFRELSKQGWIETTGSKRSSQPHRKGGRVQVWVGTEAAQAQLRLFS